MHAIYDSPDPDLSKFAAGGGKLLMYHGWSDPHISPLNSVAYYEAMQKTMGDVKVAQFARIFLFPGGYHCNGGDGPFDFPLLSLIMNWVEGGVAPDVVTASHSQGRGSAPYVLRQVGAWPAERWCQPRSYNGRARNSTARATKRTRSRSSYFCVIVL